MSGSPEQFPKPAAPPRAEGAEETAPDEAALKEQEPVIRSLKPERWTKESDEIAEHIIKMAHLHGESGMGRPYDPYEKPGPKIAINSPDDPREVRFERVGKIAVERFEEQVARMKLLVELEAKANGHLKKLEPIVPYPGWAHGMQGPHQPRSFEQLERHARAVPGRIVELTNRLAKETGELAAARRKALGGKAGKYEAHFAEFLKHREEFQQSINLARYDATPLAALKKQLESLERALLKAGVAGEAGNRAAGDELNDLDSKVARTVAELRPLVEEFAKLHEEVRAAEQFFDRVAEVKDILRNTKKALETIRREVGAHARMGDYLHAVIEESEHVPHEILETLTARFRGKAFPKRGRLKWIGVGKREADEDHRLSPKEAARVRELLDDYLVGYAAAIEAYERASG